MAENVSIYDGTPEKTAVPSLKMADGEKVAQEFSFAGVSCTHAKMVESPTAYTHFLRVDNPASLRRLKSAAEIVAFRLRSNVACRMLTTNEGDDDGDFVAVVDKPVADSVSWKNYKELLTEKTDYIIGVDLENNPVVLNLDDVPHLLIAGSSGAGKSVALHTIIGSLINKNIVKEGDIGLALIDTKKTELVKYRDSKYLSCGVATTYLQAFDVLTAAVKCMKKRYTEMSAKGKKKSTDGHVVIVIDELADLMMQGKRLIEPLIVQIAQQGRAANIHLIVATQRPTVDVCTGHIKANLPARLALLTASVRDSMNIIDKKGAETLRGKGDALLRLPGQTQLTRLQICTND